MSFFYVTMYVQVTSEIKNEIGEEESFLVPYDYLVYAVGAQSGTFGVKGVKEHCYFLKEIPDAMELRTALVDTFERVSHSFVMSLSIVMISLCDTPPLYIIHPSHSFTGKYAICTS